MPRQSRSPRELLTPAALHMLMALARGDLHGYAIKQAVEARTEGRLRLGPGTLYEGIHRMEAAGWIRGVDGGGEGLGRRKVYRITAAGRRVMEDELARLQAVGLIDDEDFRDFMFANAVRFWGEVNPDFFKGTVVEKQAAEVLAHAR